MLLILTAKAAVGINNIITLVTLCSRSIFCGPVSVCPPVCPSQAGVVPNS